MKHNRGAVLVESAFAVSLLLLVIYGGVELGLVGLQQLTADGGAYAAAHEAALIGANLKNYQDAPTAAKAALPPLSSSSISVPTPFGQPPSTQPASDLAGYSVQYNLADPTARHGGVSMVQPVQAVAFVTRTNFASLLLNFGQTISVTGIAIDPAFRLINGHGNVSGFNFNTTESLNDNADPLVNADNAPPYFVGLNYMRQCPYSNALNQKVGWNACPQFAFAALGMAEYLDTANWGRQFNGVVPDGTAVFYETRLHQNKFANIALALAGAAGDDTKKADILDPSHATGDTACVYSFDNANLGSYTVGTTKIGDFPLNPQGDPAKCN